MNRTGAERYLLTPNNLAAIGTVVIVIIFLGLLRLSGQNSKLGSEVQEANLELLKSNKRTLEFVVETEKKLSFQTDSLKAVIDSLRAVIAKFGEGSGQSFPAKRKQGAISSGSPRTESSAGDDQDTLLNRLQALHDSRKNDPPESTQILKDPKIGADHQVHEELKTSRSWNRATKGRDDFDSTIQNALSGIARKDQILHIRTKSGLEVTGYANAYAEGHILVSSLSSVNKNSENYLIKIEDIDILRFLE